MSSFKNISKQIFNILNSLSHEQCIVLFGEANRFEEWLIDQQVIDNVRILKSFK